RWKDSTPELDGNVNNSRDSKAGSVGAVERANIDRQVPNRRSLDRKIHDPSPTDMILHRFPLGRLARRLHLAQLMPQRPVPNIDPIEFLGNSREDLPIRTHLQRAPNRMATRSHLHG